MSPDDSILKSEEQGLSALWALEYLRVSDLDFSLVFVSVYDTFHPHYTALCLPLPFGLQLSVVSLPLLLESSLRLLFIVAATVSLWLGLIYFKLLCSNNVRRPEVRETRKKVNGKLLNIVTGEQ